MTRTLMLALTLSLSGCDEILRALEDADGADATVADDAPINDEDATVTVDPTTTDDAIDDTTADVPEVHYDGPTEGSGTIEGGAPATVGPITIEADPESLAEPIVLDVAVVDYPAPMCAC